MESPLRSWTSRLWVAAALWMLALPTTALADAQVQFLHAVPGVGKATLSVDGQPVGSAAFAELSSPSSVSAAGVTKLVLKAPGGVKLARTVRFADGASYTVVGLATGKAAMLHLYRNGGAEAGMARLRMVHAAPELGDADLALNGNVVARDAPYRAETKYWTLPPGTEKLTVQDPGSEQMALGKASVPLSAGTATTAYVVGSKGERVRVVLVDDASSAPAAAPQTGLGGLASSGSGQNWALVIAAALAAGGAGALLRRRATR